MLLHGFLGDSCDWQTIIDALSPSIPCIAIDLPGHGQSQSVRLNELEGFAECSQLIKQTLNQFGISRYLLLGYSLGGRIALYHAAHNPQSIAGLILESSHPGLESEQEKSQRLTNDQRWAARFVFEPKERVLQDWYRQAVFSALSTSQRESLVQKRLAIDTQCIVNLLLATSLARQDALDCYLSGADFPCYYLYGESDEKLARLAQKLEARYPELATSRFTDAGHNVHWEQPLEFIAKIQEIYFQVS